MTNYVFVIVLFIRHAQCSYIDYLLQVAKYAVGFFEDAGVSGCDSRKFRAGEIRVGEHFLEIVDIVAGDVAEHQDCLLHLAGIADKVVHRLESVIIFFGLLIDFHRFLKILDHMRRRLRLLYE